MKAPRQYLQWLSPSFIPRNGALLLVCLFFVFNTVLGQETVLETRVNLPKQNSSVYSLLNQISQQTGYFFIYDSQLIDNNRKVNMRRTRQELHSLLDEILNDKSLSYRVIHSHILIYRPGEETPEPLKAIVPSVKETHFIVRGRLLDQISGNPLAYASVGIPEKGMGISTNNDGFFQLKLPLELIDQTLRVSYMGYKSQEFPLQLLRGNQIDIFMETEYISMQEVIIRYYDPRAIILEAIEKKQINYSNEPVYLLSFYREGVQRNNKFINYSEAIFRVFKASYELSEVPDQVVMLKARNIVNIDQTDTLNLKLKAGVHTSLELDIMKNIPDFLDPDLIDNYDFENADIVTRNGRSIFAIEFKQKEHLREPLFQGMLYIDMENMALIEAEFEMNPRYIRKAQDSFLARRSPHFVPSLEKVIYSIKYQFYDGHYYLSHVRGELKLKFRRRKQLFSNNYTAFLEMAVIHIDTEDVQRFSRREVLKTNTILIDAGYQYDYDFWGDYNIITPEARISEALTTMQSKIESFFIE